MVNKDLDDIERRIRELNEAIAEVGASIRQMSPYIQDLGYQFHPETHPQYQVAIFRWG